MDYISIIKDYFEKRKLKMPDFSDAMKFVITEVGEVLEVDLSRKGYVRNNPQNKPVYNKEELAMELGDAIMMLIVAGITEGVDPLDAMVKKIERKLQALNSSNTNHATLRGLGTLISSEEYKVLGELE